MSENVKTLIPSGAFSNYVPKDEVSGAVYPNASGIMFINLKKLSQKNSVAGELASFLLGKTDVFVSKEVKQIADTFKKSCAEFCKDKGVKKSMSVAEKRRMEGLAEGLAEGRVEGRAEERANMLRELSELNRPGMSLDEALQIIRIGNMTQVET